MWLNNHRSRTAHHHRARSTRINRHMTNLLLLHAALGARAQFDPHRAALAQDFSVHSLDFEGHGAEGPTARPFRIETFAENVVAYLDAHAIEMIDIFGYSMGGYVALYLARVLPARIGAIFTLGTKLRWDQQTAEREVRMLDARKIREKVPHFARALEERHSGAGWESVLEKTAEMMLALGTNSPLDDDDFRAIAHRVRIGVGDRDATVRAEESAGVYRLLPNAELEVFPRTGHPIERVSTSRLTASIGEFFSAA